MITIAEIISTATNVVGNAHRDASGIGYYAYVPYYCSQPHGPSTEIRASSRDVMVRMLRAQKAAIALSMAKDEYDFRGSEWNDDVDQLIDRIDSCPSWDRYGVPDWRGAVRELIRKHRDGV